MGIRSIIFAPAQAFKYLNASTRASEARYAALSEDEKAELRYRGMKNWAYRVFPSPGRTRPKGRP
jgi:hypothetical protein